MHGKHPLVREHCGQRHKLPRGPRPWPARHHPAGVSCLCTPWAEPHRFSHAAPSLFHLQLHSTEPQGTKDKRSALCILPPQCNYPGCPCTFNHVVACTQTKALTRRDQDLLPFLHERVLFMSYCIFFHAYGGFGAHNAQWLEPGLQLHSCMSRRMRALGCCPARPLRAESGRSCSETGSGKGNAGQLLVLCPKA